MKNYIEYHDKILDFIYDNIEDLGELLFYDREKPLLETVFKRKVHTNGSEIDILGRRNGKIVIIEIKTLTSSFSRSKVMTYLKRLSDKKNAVYDFLQLFYRKSYFPQIDVCLIISKSDGLFVFNFSERELEEKKILIDNICSFYNSKEIRKEDYNRRFLFLDKNNIKDFPKETVI